jgi:hypothetical protein
VLTRKHAAAQGYRKRLIEGELELHLPRLCKFGAACDAMMQIWHVHRNDIEILKAFVHTDPGEPVSTTIVRKPH